MVDDVLFSMNELTEFLDMAYKLLDVAIELTKEVIIHYNKKFDKFAVITKVAYDMQFRLSSVRGILDSLEADGIFYTDKKFVYVDVLTYDAFEIGKLFCVSNTKIPVGSRAFTEFVKLANRFAKDKLDAEFNFAMKYADIKWDSIPNDDNFDCFDNLI